jgi:hypothetical protein
MYYTLVWTIVEHNGVKTSILLFGGALGMVRMMHPKKKVINTFLLTYL